VSGSASGLVCSSLPEGLPREALGWPWLKADIAGLFANNCRFFNF
jgi:hypothetical protein